MLSQSLYQRYAKDPLAFFADLYIDVSGIVRKWGDVMDDFQREDFASLSPGLLVCAGRQVNPNAKLRALYERPRGASKSSDLGAVAIYLLAFSQTPARGYAFAGDRDQAKILRDAMQTLVRLNPWLQSILEVERHRVINIAQGHPAEGASLTIEASDVGSSYGILPDFVIIDELTHWEENAAGLWDSLISSAAKRTNCLLVIIQNSGFTESWQWNVRESVREDPNWIFSRLEGQASWMTEERLAEQRRLLPPVAFARLWLNQWSSGGGDLLTEADLAAAFKPELNPIPAKLDGWEFVAGVDLSVSRDASAIAIIGIRKRRPWEEEHSGHGRSRLAATKVWKPTPGVKVDLQKVEDALLALHDKYDFRSVFYDPWQAEHIAQRLHLQRVPMNECQFTGGNLQKMASTLIEAFNDRRVDCYENPELRRDLARARIVERSFGFRIEFLHDAHGGHGDLGTAFALSLLAATEIAGRPSRRATSHSNEEIEEVSGMAAKLLAKQKAYQREMEMLARGGSDDRQEQFVRMMTGLPPND